MGDGPISTINLGIMAQAGVAPIAGAGYVTLSTVDLNRLIDASRRHGVYGPTAVKEFDFPSEEEMRRGGTKPSHAQREEIRRMFGLPPFDAIQPTFDGERLMDLIDQAYCVGACDWRTGALNASRTLESAAAAEDKLAWAAKISTTASLHGAKAEAYRKLAGFIRYAAGATAAIHQAEADRRALSTTYRFNQHYTE